VEAGLSRQIVGGHEFFQVGLTPRIALNCVCCPSSSILESLHAAVVVLSLHLEGESFLSSCLLTCSSCHEDSSAHAMRSYFS